MAGILVLLLWVIVLILVVQVIVWALKTAGVSLPQPILAMIWVIAVLIILIYLVTGPLNHYVP